MCMNTLVNNYVKLIWTYVFGDDMIELKLK